MTVQLGSSPPLVSFVIVNYQVAEKVEEAVLSIEQFCDVPYEVVVVDNSESEAELQILERTLEGRALVIDAGENRGFGAGCNLGARHAAGVYLFLLNPDARLLSRSVGRLVEHLATDDKLGAIGGKLVYADGSEGHSCGRFIGLRRPLQLIKGSLYGYRDHLLGRMPERGPKRKLATGLQRVDWCSGAALLMRKSDFTCVDGFDETYFMYYEECDLQYRLRHLLGLHAAIDADVAIFHEDGGTGLGDARRRALIEGGCLRFVHDHRGQPVYLAYKLMILSAVAVEGLLRYARGDLDEAQLHARLAVAVARFRTTQRATSDTLAISSERSARARTGGTTWHPETNPGTASSMG